MAHPAARQLVGESLYRRIRLIHWDHPVRPYVERAAAASLTLTALSVSASPAAASPSLAVKDLTTSQNQALSKGTLDVRVRSSRRGKVRVNALARKTARGRVRVARSALVRFKKAGHKTAHMRLTSAGRDVVETCEGTRITISARRRDPRRRRGPRPRAGPPPAVTGGSGGPAAAGRPGPRRSRASR